MPRAPVLGLSLVCALAAIVLLPNLGRYPLLDPDEGRHAAIAREMLAAPTWRGWIVPTLGGEPYYDKPVLFYWLTAAIYRLVGVGELGARLVSTLSAFGTIALVLRLGRVAWGRRAGLAAAAVCATSTGLVAVAHLATLDMLLTFWITAAVAALGSWRQSGRLGTMAGVGMLTGCGTLTKGLVAPLVVGSLAAVLLVDPAARRHLRPATIAVGLVAFLAVTVPWHAAALVVDPAYLPALYLQHHLARAAGTIATSHTEPSYYYVPVLAVAFLPWTALLPAALAAGVGRLHGDTTSLASAIWAGIVLAVFSASSTKLPTYILPVIPPLALLVGRYVTHAPRADHHSLARLLERGGLGLAALACAVAPVVLWISAERAYGGTFAPLAPLGTVFLPFALALTRCALRDRPPWGPAVLGTLSATVAILVFGVVAPVLAPMRSAQPLAAAIHDAGLPPETPIVGFGTRAPSLLFYSDRRPLLTRRLADVRALRAAHPLVLVMTTPRHRERLEAAGPWHPWVTGPRVLLLGSDPPPGGTVRRFDGAGGNTPFSRL